VRCGIGVCGGIDRELKAVAEAFTSPWFDFELTNVRTALVIVSADEVDGGMVEKIARDVAFRVPNARVRYTSREDKALGGKLKTVVLLGFGPPNP
jgi:hypothetical protein